MSAGTTDTTLLVPNVIESLELVLKTRVPEPWYCSLGFVSLLLSMTVLFTRTLGGI